MRRALIAVAILAVLGALLASPPRPTVAAWADSEKSTGSFAAYTVPKPTITSCTANTSGFNANITMKWSYNSTSPAPTSTIWFSTTSMATLAPLAAGVTTTGPVTGVYTTSYDAALNNSFGTTVYVGVSAAQLGWASQIATATAAIAYTGAGTCTITP